MNQTKGVDSLFKSCSRYTGVISPCFPFLSTASLRVVGQEGHTPLLYGVVVVETVALNPLVQGVTHTHTHGAASRRSCETPQ